MSSTTTGAAVSNNNKTEDMAAREARAARERQERKELIARVRETTAGQEALSARVNRTLSSVAVQCVPLQFLESELPVSPELVVNVVRMFLRVGYLPFGYEGKFLVELERECMDVIMARASEELIKKNLI